MLFTAKKKITGGTKQCISYEIAYCFFVYFGYYLTSQNLDNYKKYKFHKMPNPIFLNTSGGYSRPVQHTVVEQSFQTRVFLYSHTTIADRTSAAHRQLNPNLLNDISEVMTPRALPTDELEPYRIFSPSYRPASNTNNSIRGNTPDLGLTDEEIIALSEPNSSSRFTVFNTSPQTDMKTIEQEDDSSVYEDNECRLLGLEHGTLPDKMPRLESISPVKNTEEGTNQSLNNPIKSSPSRYAGIRDKKFNIKLRLMIELAEDMGLEHLISWTSDGKNVRLPKTPQHRSEFEEKILSYTFECSNSYHSFNRILTAWDFKRIKKGVDKGAYTHPLFQRDNRQLAEQMHRQPSKRVSKAANPEKI